MIVDASALLAVIFCEPGCEALLRKMMGAAVVAAGAPTLTEARTPRGRSRGGRKPAFRQLTHPV